METEKPHVTVFGEDVPRSDTDREARREERREWRRYRHEHRGVVGGAILLCIGVIFLLNTLGFVSWDFWYVVERFWPIVIVLIGVQILLGRSVFSRIVMLILTLAVLGSIIFYGLQHTRYPFREAPGMMGAYGTFTNSHFFQ